MLNHVKLFLLIFFLIITTRCVNDRIEKNMHDIFLQKSISVVGEKEYFNIYNKLKDSLDLWVLNNLRSFEAEATYDYQIDSLICFNPKADRFFSCIHIFGNQFDSKADDLHWFYGEKIKSLWYFFAAETTVIPREMIKGQDIKKPLSYLQLHQMALKEVYSGYLKSNGEINEEWFKSRFENVGWCSKCKTTEDFQQAHLRNVRTLWLQRDTTQPIKQLPPKTEKLP